MQPFGWDQQFVYKEHDNNDPWNNPPISSTQITIKPNPDYIVTRGNYIFEPSSKEFEQVLSPTQDDSQMKSSPSDFNMGRYMESIRHVTSVLDNNHIFTKYSSEKFVVVAHRLISTLVHSTFDFEVLVHRHGKLYATHLRIRGGPTWIKFAKVMGSVAQSDLTLLREFSALSSPYPVIYPEKTVPLGTFPGTYYRRDNIENMFLPSDPLPYLLEFKMKHHL